MNTRAGCLSIFGFFGAFLAVGPVRGEPGDLIGYLPFVTEAPQDIALDKDGTYWISALFDNKVYHYGPGLRDYLGEFDYPYPSSYLTGIAYNSLSDTLFVADTLRGEIAEVQKDGTPTGLVILPAFEQPPGLSYTPSIRGMAFNPTGDGGKGSIYFVEAAGTLIYEIRLDGSVIWDFPHPDDADRFPGKGASAASSDVDLIYDEGRKNVIGYYVTGGSNRITHIRRLERDGSYKGLSIPLADAGGTVSGFLRIPFERPDTGEKVDSYVCVVESPPGFAILKGGEPEYRELTGFTCTSSGQEVRLSWVRNQDYDRIEVSRGCELVATLPGTASEWQQVFDTDGVYELTVRAFLGNDSASPPTCTIVFGPGEVLRSAPVGGSLPVDIAADGQNHILVTEGQEHKILLFDADFNRAGEIAVNAELAEETDIITGIAVSQAGPTIFVFNASKSKVGVLDESGALLSVFTAKLPNLEGDPGEDPDFGLVLGMAYDPTGDGGRGSLWVVERNRDWIYEIGIAESSRGEILRSFPHPYLAIEPPPDNTPFGISSSGISTVAGGSPDELYLTGGALRELRQPHIFRADKRTGLVIPGSVIPTDGIRVAASTTFIAIESFVEGGKTRLVALSIAGPSSKLLDVRDGVPPVAAPTFLTAAQTGFEDSVLLRFTPNGPYDKLELERDCVRLAEIPGDAVVYRDSTAPAGFREYELRGVRGGVASDIVRASVQVGIGAVLQRAFVWPARSPQQLTQDPSDGSLAVTVNWAPDERKVFHFDREFRYLSTRDSVVPEDWEIATLAIRAPKDAEKELDYIAWQLPVPIGQAASQKFLLVKETWSGAPLGGREISLPRPTNGFVTFPTGLTWHPETDTFYLLERNSKTFVEMTPNGNILRTFPHPAPPFQNFIFNLGVTYAPRRGTLFTTGSDRYDLRVTKAMEMTLDGALTGVEIPLQNIGITVTGIALRGDELIAVGTGAFSELLQLKAPSQVSTTFVRGDTDGNGAVNLTDAIVTLNYLLQGGTPLACEDAVDADDSGELNLTDAIATLRSLFRGTGPLPPPYPEGGFDPTTDDLTCF